MSKVKVETRNDGVYMVVDNSGGKVSRRELLDAIDQNNLKQVDFSVVNEILKSTENIIEKKVSDKINVDPIDEDFVIDISRDKLKASIKFSPAQFGGDALGAEAITERLSKEGITYNVDREAVEELAQAGHNKEYDQKYVVAKGEAPIAGEDGEIIYNFDMTGEKNQPKILGDGTVDYKQINYFNAVSAGMVLAKRTMPGPGQAGMNVLGEIVPPRPGKLAPKLSKGKNTFITDDELQLIAQASGQLVVSGKNLGVSPVLDIKGDVDFSTGNIDFEGSVNVAGAVLSGFSITAAGNIEVRGVVEEASLLAGGSINLYGGVMGRGKGRVESGCNIFTKFVQNATIIAKGNLKTNSLLHSEVSVDGSVVLEGDNCFIAGGVITAGDEIRAKTIGSSMGTMTELVVGRNNELQDELEMMKREYEEAEEAYIKLNSAYEAFSKVATLETMDTKRKTQLLQLLQQRNLQRDRAQGLEREIQFLEDAAKQIKGRIIAERIIYAGVKVSIGNAYKQLNDDITMSVLKNEGGMVKARPLLE
ncbi:MAG: FapA family protein [Clostridiales bacterium]|jgi:uncharacterized protein (DUF342 family)|nr:FapA family protein [Clostridiales bacterium]